MKLETFFEKFQLFADAPDAVAKMRELVLELAVQGKLVQQDPLDVSAEELLKQFELTRECIPQGRRGRRLEVLPPVEPDEWPHEIPEGWAWSRLGTLGLIGSSSRVHQKDWTTVGVPFLRAREIVRLSKFGQVNNELFITEEHYQRLAAEGLTPKPNDIMITGVGTIGVPYVVKSSDHFYFKDASVLIFKNLFDLYPHYLHIVMQSPYWIQQVHQESMGTTVHTLTIVRAKQTPIPLPPLAEQKRIVAKVDELMESCDRLEAQQQKRETQHAALARASLSRFADAPTPANLGLLFHKSYSISPADLRKSILTLAVQGKLVPQDPNDEPAAELIERLAREMSPENRRPQAAPLPPLTMDSVQYELPESWTWARFREVAIIASNLVKPNDFLDFTHLAPDNIQKGNGLLLPCSTVREDKVVSSKHRFYPGQIVYSKIRPNLAKVVIVDFDGLCSADMYPIDALIDVTYLQRYMLAEAFLIQAVKTDTRVAMPKINQAELNAIAVPVPPLAEQGRIVAKVAELMALVDALETQLATAQSTGATLMKAAVSELTAAA